MNDFIKEDFLKIPKKNFIHQKLGIYDGEDEIVSDYQRQSTSIVNNYIAKNDTTVQRAFEQYTGDYFSLINKFLGSNFFNEQLYSFSGLNLFDSNFKIPENIKFPIKYEDSFSEILEQKEIIIHFIKNINTAFNKISFTQNILTFRGLPIKGSNQEFKSDFWLRKEYFVEGNDISLKVNGDFQELIYDEVIVKKEKTLDDFYEVGKTIHTKTFLSTSLSKKIAISFGTANNEFGHLLIIKCLKEVPGIYIDKISSCQGEQEVLLPMNCPLILDRVEYLSNVNFDEIRKFSGKYLDNIKDKPNKHSLCFFFTYSEKNPEKLNEEKLQQDEIFWNNLEKIYNKIIWV